MLDESLAVVPVRAPPEAGNDRSGAVGRIECWSSAGFGLWLGPFRDRAVGKDALIRGAVATRFGVATVLSLLLG